MNSKLQRAGQVVFVTCLTSGSSYTPKMIEEYHENLLFGMVGTQAEIRTWYCIS
jgi:hypothetical protein